MNKLLGNVLLAGGKAPRNVQYAAEYVPLPEPARVTMGQVPVDQSKELQASFGPRQSRRSQTKSQGKASGRGSTKQAPISLKSSNIGMSETAES